MEDQKKKRKRKIVQRTKGPELVRSVKTGMVKSMTTATSSTALQQFQELWK